MRPYLPDRTEDIQRGIRPQIELYGKGIDQLRGETAAAVGLAEAGPRGILLPLAEKIALDAQRHFNETEWDSHEAESAIKSKTKLLPSAQLHRRYLSSLAEVRLALADVYLHEGKLQQAKPLLDEAYALQPDEISTNVVLGEYELATQDFAAALTSFEHAAVAHDTAETFSANSA